MARNLRTFDLNLLVAFDALLKERHVTRAANRVGLSQPAMSNALARLRDFFDDDILVRTARGMEPTSRALDVAQQTGIILRQIERVLDTDSAFDPRTTTIRFNLRLSDLLEALILPVVLKPFARQAPRAGLDLLHLSPEETLEALEDDLVDAAVSTGLPTPTTIVSNVLFEDQLVCVMRKGHPARKDWSLDTFLAQRHVKVSISPTDSRFVDNVLSSMKLSRDIALTTPHWLILPQVLQNTDYIAVMTERLAKNFGRVASFEIRPTPFKTETIKWTLYWHRRHDGSPAHAWFRQFIIDCCRPLSTG